MNDLQTVIDNLVKAIMANPYVGLIGFVIGIISLIYAIYIGQRDKRIKYLDYTLTSTNVIADRENLYPKLDITYDNQHLDNFTVTKMRIKNIGTEVINPNDVAMNDPIRIGIIGNNSLLLDFGISYSSDSNNNFILTRLDERLIEVRFDYIEPQDMVSIEILHTGKDSDAVSVSGTVIGAYKPFAVSKLKDITMRGSILERIYILMYNHPRRAVVFMSFGMIVVLGLLTYSMFSVNQLLSVLCLIPLLLIAYFFIRMMVRRPNPQTDPLVRDVLNSFFTRVTPITIAERHYRDDEDV